MQILGTTFLCRGGRDFGWFRPQDISTGGVIEKEDPFGNRRRKLTELHVSALACSTTGGKCGGSDGILYATLKFSFVYE